MATPSLAMIPSAYADSKVYSVLPNNGDGDFTFNRDSSATRVGQNGLIQTVGYFGNELVVNGDFATDTDWNKNANWTISGGKANADGTSSADINQNTNLPTIGKTYLVTYTISNYTSGTFKVQFGGVLLGAKNAVGTYEETLTAVSTDRLRIKGTTPLGSISYISVKEVTGDQPRLNYDISNGVVQSCPSLLLEPASTNFLPESNNYSDSVWSKQANGTASVPVVTSNYSISPDGTKNADRVVFNLNGGTTSSDFSQLAESVTTSVGDVSNSVYIKSNTSANYVMSFIKPDGSAASITVTQEWQRFSSTFTLTGTTSVFKLRLRGSESTADYADVSIYGAQIEEQPYATSLIPTYGSSQTRAAETCNDAGNAATFNSTEGVLYAEISALANDGTFRQLTLSDSSTSDRVSIDFTSTDNQIRSFSSSGGSTAANMTGSVSNATQFNKVAVKYKLNDYALWINGVEVATDTSGAAPIGLSELAFDNGGGSNDFYGKVKDIRVYNEALTDAQLQTLTTL